MVLVKTNNYSTRINKTVTGKLINQILFINQTFLNYIHGLNNTTIKQTFPPRQNSASYKRKKIAITKSHEHTKLSTNAAK